MKASRSCELYVDGASRGNPGPAGIGVVAFNGSAAPAHQLSKPIGQATNNVAEYLALIYALHWALGAGYTAIAVKTDSELLVRQIHGQYRVREPHLRLFHDLAQDLFGHFARWSLAHVPREQNTQADRLAAAAARRALGAARANDPSDAL